MDSILQCILTGSKLKRKHLCDAFYLIKIKPYYCFASIGICLQDSPHFLIHFCIKILQPVEIKELKMTFVGRTTLSFT